MPEKIDEVFWHIKSEEVRSYITHLARGSKAETALRESFIAGKSILLKYFFGEASPEVRTDGFIDYLIKDEMGRGIALELKPLFEAEVELDKAGKPVLKRLRQKQIKPEDYRDQILKYIREGEAQFVILTNLMEWFFYSKELSPKDVKYFCAIGLFDFIREYDVIGSLRDYLERKEFESIRYELDKRFLESLKTWVNKISEVKFTADDKRKLELIIELINKFIFVQTLDDYGVIEFNWIRKRWNHHEQMWQRKGKLIVLEKFFDELDEWFYLYYDTELFKEKILQYIEKSDENIDKLHRNLQLVLGLTYLQVPLGAFKGIMQYNFRYIDEDIFGKAYETFLAEVRHEEGVYYTPKYITQSIVENTVGKILDELILEIKKKISEKEFTGAKKSITTFVSLRFLDPACGSGSFLIKAIRTIVDRYDRLIQLIENAEKSYVIKHSNYLSSLSYPQEIKKLELLSDIKRMIGPNKGRELISKILIRHIHGNDLDRRALEVAKVNVWLEAIKLSPKEFRYDKLPPDTNYILPNLGMNLCNGDSVVGIHEDFAIQYLHDRHQAGIIKLSELRRQYLQDPTSPKLIEEIEKIKHEIRKELDEEYKKYLTTQNFSIDIISETKPFHWVLEFWYVFFDENGNPLPEAVRGFDAVIGNPPYVDSETMTRSFPVLREYCTKRYDCASGNWDLFCVFVERGIINVKTGGHFGFILPNKLLSADYAEGTRNLIKKFQVEILSDYSRVKVFDAAVYPIVLILKKNPWNETDKIDVNIFHEVTGKAPEVIRHSELSLKELYNLPGNIWSPAVDPASEVLSRIREKSSLISEHYTVLGGATVSEAYEICIKLKELKDDRPQEYLKFVNTGTIDKYISLWEFAPTQFIKKTYFRPIISIADLKEISEKRLQESRMEKVIIAGMCLELECFYDIGEYLAGKSTVIVLDGKASLKGLVGILNSQASSFILRKLFGSLALGGGYLRVGPPQVSRLPIPSAFLDSQEKQKQLENLVDRIEVLKKSHYRFVSLWHEWSIKMKNTEVSFQQMLMEDMKKFRDGKFRNVWTSRASFYPDAKSEGLYKEFVDFRISGSLERPAIRIYGLNENKREELIYEMDFSNRDLMLHVYFSLVYTLRSRMKIKTLSQLFAKTKFPIIKEVNTDPTESTPNIIRKAKDEFEKWLKEDKIEDVETDIVKIDNEIKDIEAEIDALVFKLYELREDEIEVVFDSLKTPTSHQGRVLEFFRKL